MDKIAMSIFLVSNIPLISSGAIDILPGYNSRSYEMPDTCAGLSFCKDKGDHYPTDVVNRALKTILKIQPRIGEEIDNYESRVSKSPLEPECKMNQTNFDPIYYISDENNQTRVVIQSKEYGFWQKYDIRWCTKVGRVSKTEHISNMTLHGFNMTCNNIKRSLDFLVLKLDTLDVELISAKMPVFCKARL